MLNCLNNYAVDDDDSENEIFKSDLNDKYSNVANITSLSENSNSLIDYTRNCFWEMVDSKSKKLPSTSIIKLESHVCEHKNISDCLQFLQEKQQFCQCFKHNENYNDDEADTFLTNFPDITIADKLRTTTGYLIKVKERTIVKRSLEESERQNKNIIPVPVKYCLKSRLSLSTATRDIIFYVTVFIAIAIYICGNGDETRNHFRSVYLHFYEECKQLLSRN